MKSDTQMLSKICQKLGNSCWWRIRKRKLKRDISNVSGYVISTNGKRSFVKINDLPQLYEQIIKRVQP